MSALQEEQSPYRVITDEESAKLPDIQSPDDEGTEYEDADGGSSGQVGGDSPSQDAVSGTSEPDEEVPPQPSDEIAEQKRLERILLSRRSVERARHAVSEADVKMAHLKASLDALKKEQKDLVEKLIEEIEELDYLIKNEDFPDATQPTSDGNDNPKPKVIENWEHAKITELNFDSIKGFGVKKRDILFAACSTIGELEKLRAGDGFQSLEGFGPKLSEDLENLFIEWYQEYSKNSDKPVLATSDQLDDNDQSEDFTIAEEPEPAKDEPPEEVATEPEDLLPKFDVNNL